MLSRSADALWTEYEAEVAIQFAVRDPISTEENMSRQCARASRYLEMKIEPWNFDRPTSYILNLISK